MKKRIWELDAARGICILGMIVVHAVYDMVELYRLVSWEYPAIYSFVQRWGGVLFLLISGICVTLGSRSVKRGLIVLGCGLLVSAVTVGMYLLDFADKSILIYFGVLHCLGACMLLWPVFKKLPNWALITLGILMVLAGLYLDGHVRADHYFLVLLGVMPSLFQTSDYFPLLPNLGFFLLGAVLGQTVYHKQESLLPKADEKKGVLRFLCGCGKHSLWIYLLHQPILAGLCMALSYLV
jgi:uncharacterized membrane protein